MTTQAEKTGIANVAKTMSIKDLKWQVANARKLGIPAELNKLFKDELARRDTIPVASLGRGNPYFDRKK